VTEEGDDLVQVPRSEWEAMKARMAGLERLVAAPTAASDPAGDGRTDRRGLLKHGAVLAAGVVAGSGALMAASASPAAAASGDSLILGADNDAGNHSTILTAEGVGGSTLLISSNGGGALQVEDGVTPGDLPLTVIVGVSNNASPAARITSQGVGGALQAFVAAAGASGVAVQAENYVATNSSPAVQANTVGTGPAVTGQINNAASSANAVYGTTNGTGAAVVGQITNAASSAVAVGGVTNGLGAAFGGLAVGTGPAVAGPAWGTGPAVVAQVVSSSNSQPAVAATTASTGAALQGTATGTGGRGAILAGVAAQLRLTPASGSTHPTSGQTGDLFVDSTGRLWFCTAGGTTATWGQLQVV
jgi:hypothetical protein